MLGEGRTLALSSSLCTALSPSSGFGSPHGARNHRTRKIYPPWSLRPLSPIICLPKGRLCCRCHKPGWKHVSEAQCGGQGTRGSPTNSKFELGPPDGSEVRALQDHVTEGGSEVLVEEREDDCPHLCDCFYHRPLHRAFCHWRHPHLGNPSLPALLLGCHLPWCMPRGALSPVLLHVECCLVLPPRTLKPPVCPREHGGPQKERAGLWLHFRGPQSWLERPREPSTWLEN